MPREGRCDQDGAGMADGEVLWSGREARVARLATCIECGQVSGPLWMSWRAYRVDDPESSEPEIALYCPACATREFGPRPRRRLDADE